MDLERKTYYLSEADLVINTMIDALKYENRRVIDIEDISSYERESRKLFQQENINVIFYRNGETKEEFDSEIEEYLVRHEDKYILLPWLEQKDLIQNFRGSIPLDVIKVIARKNRNSFLEKRSQEVLESFHKINSLVIADSVESVASTVEILKEKQIILLKKMKKVKKYEK